MRVARAAQLMSAALFPLLSACSVLTGTQSIPPPWDSSAAPSEPVLPGAQSHFAPSPSFLRLDGAIANPTGYPVPWPETVVVPPPVPPSTAAPASASAPLAAVVLADQPVLGPPPVTSAIPASDGVLMTGSPLPEPAPPPVSAPSNVLSPAKPARVAAPVLVAETRMKPPAPAEPTRTAPSESDTVQPTPARDAALPSASPPPVASAATLPDGFVVGPGDLVTISVFGRPELTVNANVSSDGRVPMALIGNIKIGGLSPGQASDRIATALREGQYLVNPQVSVVFNEYRSRQISVLGEVKTPGRFPVNTRMTVLDAIALAGGINDLGSQSALILRPQGTIVTRYEVDIDELLDAGVGQEYFDLKGGDTVIVPRAEVFYIYGEVKTPNMYKLRPGMTVVQALSLGGGLTDKGSDRRVEIRRRGADGKLARQSANLSDPLEPDDVVYVHERWF